MLFAFVDSVIQPFPAFVFLSRLQAADEILKNASACAGKWNK
ncbi:MAG: hypothetical protein NTZ64_15585 [Polaromonas sp.]|nr:hypothetical protein [Polaromonas sp.]